MSATAGPTPLLRDTRRGLVAGVLAGLGDRTGIDPTLLRVAFVVVVVATGGLVLLGYLIAWAALPAVEGGSTPLARFGRVARAPGGWRVALGAGVLTLSALLAFRELGIWWSDALVWPLVLAAFGAALLWGRWQRRGALERDTAPASPAPDVPASAMPSAEAARSRATSRLVEQYSGVFGVLLVIGAALLFLSSNNILGGLRDAALTAVVVVVAVGLILAPFLWRLGRNLAAERAERIRSQERAQLAAHLHDSVLQTLTLMQKRADDPREVAALARRQERELRDWLAGGAERERASTLASALRSAAESIEDDHRVAIELVVVGDCDLDATADAVLGAAREALTNAAKHAPDSGPIRAYAEVDAAGIELFVRDRGPGFDPAAAAPDRRGVRDSIVARMERAGGRAEIRSGAGSGTEVGLFIARDAATPEDSA
jgi:signal transduction histidine kinase/phage shock protein PspC (stress-responsive transcriptional regulator)